MKPLVIGIGNRWRRDDGVGPRAIDALTHRLPADIDLVALDGEPARLVAAWRNRPWVLVVDAIRTDSSPGTISVIDVDRLDRCTTSHRSSHAAGLDTAVALARVLDQMPDELLIVGIEPADLDHGDGLSDPVARAFDVLVDHIEATSRARIGGTEPYRRRNGGRLASEALLRGRRCPPGRRGGRLEPR